jgi:HEAT repeat protein
VQLFSFTLLFVALWGIGCSEQKDTTAETEKLIDRLQSVDERNRKPAVDKLVLMGNEIVPRLLKEMESPHTQVRFEVAHLLGRIRDKRAVPVLINALGDKSANVSQTAAWALGAIRTPEAVPVLLNYVHDVSIGMRKQVIWALGACHSDSLAPALQDSSRRAVMRALHDAEAEVRVGAVLGLRELGIGGALDEVIVLAADPSADVRYLIVQLLEQLASGAYRRALGDLPQETRDRVATALMSLLGDSAQSIRTHAIRALGQSGDARAIAMLKKLSTSGTKEDQIEAAMALKRLQSAAK